MTLQLIIDTTLSGASLALISGTETWTGFHSERGDADSAICRMLEEGLAHFARKSCDIDTVLVSHGPGSFTGIKVGLAWAYGFQAARKENLLFGLSSLVEGKRELESRSSEKIVLLLPISRREAFLCWQLEDQNPTFSSIVLFSDSAENELRKLESQSYVFYLISAETKTTEWVKTLCSKTQEISVLDFMKIAQQGMIRKLKQMDLRNLKQRIIVPQYLKKTTVEEKLEMGNRNV